MTTTFFFARCFVCITVFCKFDRVKNFWLFFSLVRRMSVGQRIKLKFHFRLGTRLFESHRRFKGGREEVEDDHRNGRPSTSRTDENVKRVRQKMRSDRRLTVRMIADELGMNSERVWSIITEDLGMRTICAKMVPRLLNEGQKKRRVQVCQDTLEQLETEPNLPEKCCYWQ